MEYGTFWYRDDSQTLIRMETLRMHRCNDFDLWDNSGNFKSNLSKLTVNLQLVIFYADDLKKLFD